MYNDFKKKRFGGDKGGYKRDGGHGGRGDWKPMFPATCATCGASCEVPFKPNGRKPVLCSHCFKKEGPSEDRGFGGDRPTRSERPTYSAPGDGNVATQLKEINDKLDAIIEALQE